MLMRASRLKDARAFAALIPTIIFCACRTEGSSPRIQYTVNSFQFPGPCFMQNELQLRRMFESF
jgi:hypothetical protein